jgi:hypothetical protein
MYCVLVATPGGKTPVGKLTPRWEGNIGMVLKRVGRLWTELI